MSRCMNWVGRCLLGIVLLGMIGCGGGGPKGVIVKGQLVKGGAPLKTPRADIGLGWVQLELHPEGKEVGAELTRAKEDGSFEFLGEGRGIAPGSYRLVVLHYEQGPPNDSLQGAFSRGRTPLKIEVPADRAGGTHDVGTLDLANAGAK